MMASDPLGDSRINAEEEQGEIFTVVFGNCSSGLGEYMFKEVITPDRYFTQPVCLL